MRQSFYRLRARGASGIVLSQYFSRRSLVQTLIITWRCPASIVCRTHSVYMYFINMRSCSWQWQRFAGEHLSPVVSLHHSIAIFLLDRSFSLNQSSAKSAFQSKHTWECQINVPMFTAFTECWFHPVKFAVSIRLSQNTLRSVSRETPPCLFIFRTLRTRLMIG